MKLRASLLSVTAALAARSPRTAPTDGDDA